MPAGLLAHAFLGVNHKKRGLRVSGAAHHVLQEFFMARCIDENVFAVIGGKPDLGRIDSDPLITLRFERVHKERPLKRHTAAVTHIPDRLHLAFGQGAGVMDKPPHQSRLSMIHMADDDDLQRLVIHNIFSLRHSGLPFCGSLSGF